MTWHRLMFHRPTGETLTAVNDPATCSCGDHFVDGAFALAHAYAANAILEEELEKKYDDLDDQFSEFVRSERG